MLCILAAATMVTSVMTGYNLFGDNTTTMSIISAIAGVILIAVPNIGKKWK